MSIFQRVRTLAEAKGRDSLRKLEKKILDEGFLGRIDGVAICDASMYQVEPDRFFKLTQEAMALVKSLDARRYWRICRHLDYIVNRELISSGNFERKLKICHVDFTASFSTVYEEWNLRRLACLLIHEATHGVLEERFILYDKEKRERIEHLCHLEEYRFAQRLEPGWADTYIGPFEPERWSLSWEGTPQERVTAIWKRLMSRRPTS